MPAPFPFPTEREARERRATSASTAEVWRRERALHAPGTKLVRVIYHHDGEQRFEPIPDGSTMDGATIFRPPLTSASASACDAFDRLAEVLALYDAKYMGLEP